MTSAMPADGVSDDNLATAGSLMKLWAVTRDYCVGDDRVNSFNKAGKGDIAAMLASGTTTPAIPTTTGPPSTATVPATTTARRLPSRPAAVHQV
jgi:hypothetical protein